jgi:MFS family permease
VKPRLFTLPFVLAGIANFLNGMAINGMLHLPGYLVELGADDLDIGMIVGTMSGAAILVRPFAGRVMDGSGRRVVILIGAVLHVIACGLYLTVDELGVWIVVVRILQGIAQGAFFSALFTYAADLVPAERRTEGIGLFGVFGMLPIAFGSLLGDLVLAHGEYRHLFIAITAIAGGALLFSLPLHDVERPKAAPGGMWTAIGQRKLWPVFFIGAMFATALASTYAFFKRFVEEEHVGSVGTFFTAYAAAAIVLRVFFGWVPDRFGFRRALYPALISVAASLAVVGLARESIAIGVAGVLAGLGHGFTFPILSALTVARAEPNVRGSSIALFTAIFDAGILAGGFTFGAITEATDLRTMYLCASALPIIGVVIFHAVERRVAS